jgi:UDP-N-acetylenolpyruvoylglucosamine reductase
MNGAGNRTEFGRPMAQFPLKVPGAVGSVAIINAAANGSATSIELDLSWITNEAPMVTEPVQHLAARTLVHEA